MIAYYAMGAGLGHLTRTLDIIEALSLPTDLLLITNSRFFKEKDKQHYEHIIEHYRSMNVISPPEHILSNTLQLSQWINEYLVLHSISALYIDVFPAGIKGELNGLQHSLPSLKTYYIARILNWRAYSPLITSDNHFICSYVLETLNEEHQRYIQWHSDSIKNINPLPTLNVCSQEISTKSPYCAVVHSGCDSEIKNLIEFAEDRFVLSGKTLPIILISPDKPKWLSDHKDVTHINQYPATDFLLQAEVIVSAAGFNIMREVAPMKAEHWVLPFARKFDDQFARATHYKQSRTS